MKRYLYIIIIPLLLLTISCNREQDYASAKFEYVGFASSRLPSNVPEGTGETISEIEVPLRYGNGVSPGRELPVTIEIDPASTAVLGKDFNLEGVSASDSKFEVTVPKDASSKSFMIKTISNYDKEENRQLILNIVSAPEGVNKGYPLDATYVVNIQDDDCEFVADEFKGDAQTTEIYVGDDPYGPYVTSFINDNGNTFTLSNFLDATDDLIVFNIDPDPTALTVEVPYQDFDYVGYDASVEGSGRVNTCGKSITVTLNLKIPSVGYEEEFDVEYVF